MHPLCDGRIALRGCVINSLRLSFLFISNVLRQAKASVTVCPFWPVARGNPEGAQGRAVSRFWQGSINAAASDGNNRIGFVIHHRPRPMLAQLPTVKMRTPRSGCGQCRHATSFSTKSMPIRLPPMRKATRSLWPKRAPPPFLTGVRWSWPRRPRFGGAEPQRSQVQGIGTAALLLALPSLRPSAMATGRAPALGQGAARDGGLSVPNVGRSAATRRLGARAGAQTDAAIAQRARDADTFVAIAHPERSQLTVGDAALLEAADAVEV